ncbi:MAG: porin family protein [Methylococcales bacterium]|nr:porin family protein [Methylococcales bacterium]MDD5754908.1 porin family protein [Methylococcales bacterium]
MTSKAKLALGVTTALVAFAAATVAPEAAAHAGKKAHKHAKKAPTYSTVETHSSSFSHSNSSNAKVDALESQLQAMQSEIRSLRAASGRAHIDPDTAKVQELDQWMTSVKSEGTPSKGSKDNMVFFRGGYGYNVDKRGGTLDPTGTTGGAPFAGAIGDHGAWYFGAGFDFGINDNLFGMMQGTEVLAELMFDYKQLGEKKRNGLTPAINAATGLPAANAQTATVNALSLAASPKIKFFKGSNFRPWLIPAGFELTVISPPSDAITVLNPGMMFGAGADYKIWKDIYAGADVRWHQSFDNLDGVNTNGVTAGGYLGLGF